VNFDRLTDEEWLQVRRTLSAAFLQLLVRHQRTDSAFDATQRLREWIAAGVVDATDGLVSRAFAIAIAESKLGPLTTAGWTVDQIARLLNMGPRDPG
jgi:hypothetical protein